MQEGDCSARSANTSSSTDSVDVIVVKPSCVGAVKVDDKVDGGNVESSSGHIGRNQNWTFVRGERPKSELSLLLFRIL